MARKKKAKKAKKARKGINARNRDRGQDRGQDSPMFTRPGPLYNPMASQGQYNRMWTSFAPGPPPGPRMMGSAHGSRSSHPTPEVGRQASSGSNVLPTPSTSGIAGPSHHGKRRAGTDHVTGDSKKARLTETHTVKRPTSSRSLQQTATQACTGTFAGSEVGDDGDTSAGASGGGEMTCKLQEMIQDRDTAMLGLRFITELHTAGEQKPPKYNCSLCACDCGIEYIIPHIIGLQHRTKFMERFHKEEYEQVASLETTCTLEKRRTVDHLAKLIEVDFCREDIVVKLLPNPAMVEESEISEDINVRFLPNTVTVAESRTSSDKEAELSSGNEEDCIIQVPPDPVVIDVSDPSSDDDEATGIVDVTQGIFVDENPTIENTLPGRTPEIPSQNVSGNAASLKGTLPYAADLPAELDSVDLALLHNFEYLVFRTKKCKSRIACPYLCGQCGHRGENADVIKRHMYARNHMRAGIFTNNELFSLGEETGLKWFTCSLCGFEQNISIMLSHMKRTPGHNKRTPLLMGGFLFVRNYKLAVRTLYKSKIENDYRKTVHIEAECVDGMDLEANTEIIRGDGHAGIEGNEHGTHVLDVNTLDSIRGVSTGNIPGNVVANQTMASPADDSDMLDEEDLAILMEFEREIFNPPPHLMHDSNFLLTHPYLCGQCGFRGSNRDLHIHGHKHAHIFTNRQLFSLQNYVTKKSKSFDCSQCGKRSYKIKGMMDHIAYKQGHNSDTPILLCGFLFAKDLHNAIQRLYSRKFDKEKKVVQRRQPGIETAAVNTTSTAEGLSINIQPGLETTTNKVIYRHQNRKKKNHRPDRVKTFVCAFCGFEAETISEVEVHKKDGGHEDAKTVDWNFALGEMTKIRSEPKKYSCSVCMFTSNVRNIVSLHIQEASSFRTLHISEGKVVEGNIAEFSGRANTEDKDPDVSEVEDDAATMEVDLQEEEGNDEDDDNRDDEDDDGDNRDTETGSRDVIPRKLVLKLTTADMNADHSKGEPVFDGPRPDVVLRMATRWDIQEQRETQAKLSEIDADDVNMTENDVESADSDVKMNEIDVNATGNDVGLLENDDRLSTQDVRSSEKVFSSLTKEAVISEIYNSTSAHEYWVSPRNPLHFLNADGPPADYVWRCTCCSIILPLDAAIPHFLHYHALVAAFSCTVCGYRGETADDVTDHFSAAEHRTDDGVKVKTSSVAFPLFFGPQADFVPVVRDFTVTLGRKGKECSPGEIIKTYKPMFWSCKLCEQRETFTGRFNITRQDLTGALKSWPIEHFAMHHSHDSPLMCRCGTKMMDGREMDSHCTTSKHKPNIIRRGRVTLPNLVGQYPEIKLCTSGSDSMSRIQPGMQRPQLTTATATVAPNTQKKKSKQSVTGENRDHDKTRTVMQVNNTGPGVPTVAFSPSDKQAYTCTNSTMTPPGDVTRQDVNYVVGKTGHPRSFLKDVMRPPDDCLWTCTTCDARMPLSDSIPHYHQYHHISAVLHPERDNDHCYPFYFGPQADFEPILGSERELLEVVEQEPPSCEPGELIKCYVAMVWLCNTCGETQKVWHDDECPTEESLLQLDTWPRRHYVMNHTHLAPFECADCGGKFYTKSEVNEHCAENDHMSEIIEVPMDIISYPTLTGSRLDLALRLERDIEMPMTPSEASMLDTVEITEAVNADASGSTVIDTGHNDMELDGEESASAVSVKEENVKTKRIDDATGDGALVKQENVKIESVDSPTGDRAEIDVPAGEHGEVQREVKGKEIVIKKEVCVDSVTNGSQMSPRNRCSGDEDTDNDDADAPKAWFII